MPRPRTWPRTWRRWLVHLPIRARPATIPGRLAKWVRRRPWIAALLVVGVVAVSATVVAVRALLSTSRLQQVVDLKGQDLARIRSQLLQSRERKQRMEEDQYFDRILAAEQAIANHDPDQAGRKLEECPERLRNWEWHQLKRRLHPEIHEIRGHTAMLCATDFAPGSHAQASCKLGVLMAPIWDTRASSFEHHIHGPDGAAYGLTFDRAGNRVATTGPDGVIRVWNIRTGKLSDLFRGHDGWAMGVAFRPDGTQLASTGEDGTIRIWNVGSAADSDPDGALPVKTLDGHAGKVFGVAFSADGSKLASAGSDGTVRIWEPGRADSRATSILRGHVGEVISVAFHPDGKRLASGGADRRVRIWDIAKGREVLQFPASTSRINALGFSPNGATLAVGGLDHSVAIWDIATGRPIVDYPGHAYAILYVGFSPDGKVLVSASQDATIKVWDPDSEPAVRQFRFEATSGGGRARGGDDTLPAAHPRWVGGVAFAPWGGELAAAGTDHIIAIWSVAGGHLCASSGTVGGRSSPSITIPPARGWRPRGAIGSFGCGTSGPTTIRSSSPINAKGFPASRSGPTGNGWPPEAGIRRK